MIMRTRSSRSKKATTASSHVLQPRTQRRKAPRRKARRSRASSPSAATTPSHSPYYEASTANTALSASSTSTATCTLLPFPSSPPHTNTLSPHHSDTWKPKVFGGAPSHQASINHGTYFYHAAQEGLLANDSNIHAGIRTTLSGPSDYENDGYCGFEIVEAREIDTIGTDGIIKKIRERVGTEKPVYLSIDIDTLDPACMCILLLLTTPV